MLLRFWEKRLHNIFWCPNSICMMRGVDVYEDLRSSKYSAATSCWWWVRKPNVVLKPKNQLNSSQCMTPICLMNENPLSLRRLQSYPLFVLDTHKKMLLDAHLSSYEIEMLLTLLQTKTKSPNKTKCLLRWIAWLKWNVYQC